MRRLPLLPKLGVAACAVALVLQGSSVASPVTVSGQSVERVEFRHQPPSCEDAVRDLGLEGQPVHCIEPPTPTYDPPQMHGRYRLFPGATSGPSPTRTAPTVRHQG
jgi:hypothetical protein